jgi:hypothetical protein
MQSHQCQTGSKNIEDECQAEKYRMKNHGTKAKPSLNKKLTQNTVSIAIVIKYEWMLHRLILRAFSIGCL